MTDIKPTYSNPIISRSLEPIQVGNCVKKAIAQQKAEHETAVELFDVAKGYQAEIKKLKAEIDQLKAEKVGLEKRLNAVHTLARMRSAVITADRWSTLRPHIKNAIKCLDRKEKALRGEHE